MPEKKPLKPVIHGKSTHGGDAIEKVDFPSRPEFYVTGNELRQPSAAERSGHAGNSEVHHAPPVDLPGFRVRQSAGKAERDADEQRAYDGDGHGSCL